MKSPEKGFYYHYKHDPAMFNDAAYEVIGTAFNTESGGSIHSDDPADFFQDEVVIYRPIFKSSLVYQNGKRYWIRPVQMFLDVLEKDGKKINRFERITDLEIIAKLEKVKEEMYG